MSSLFANTSINRSVLTFLILFSSLYAFSFVIDGAYTELFSAIGQEYFDKSVNNEPTFFRQINLSVSPDIPNRIIASVIYFDKLTPLGQPEVKQIGIEIRNEALIGVIVFISLIFSFPAGFVSNIKKFLLGIAIIYALVFLKLYVFVFDNYNYPEYAVMELSPIVSFMVYWSSYFFNCIGTQFNIFLSVLLWLLLNIPNILETKSPFAAPAAKSEHKQTKARRNSK